MMWGHYDQFSWWWFVIMPFGMLAFWALVAWATLTLVRGDRRDDKPPSSAEAVLAERYARGEIDADEYHCRLDHLRATGAARGDRS